MVAGKYAKSNPLNDVILLEGDFVSSFLVNISPFYSVVYIYLLYLCSHNELKLETLDSISKKLNCTPAELNEAMEFLSKQNLINYTSTPFAFEILSASNAAKAINLYSNDALTVYADYFAGIRALFPGRSISNAEYDKARDWVELYGFSVEAALLLIGHAISYKDTAISFSYIDKIALSWANEGITTVAAAEEYLALYRAKNHDAAKLLLHLGIKRTPTADEMSLFSAWTDKMGFDLKAIKAACAETTKVLTPSFAYLNRILENLHKLGLHSEKEIKAFLSENDSERRLISAILTALGERSKAISPSHLEALRDFKSFGFKDDILLTAARTLCENGIHSFNKFREKILELKDAQKFAQEEVITALNYKKDTPGTTEKKKSDFKGRNEQYGSSLYTDTDNLEV